MVHIQRGRAPEAQTDPRRHLDHVLLVSLIHRLPAHIASSQLSHMSDALTQIIRIDPFSLLPREVSLRVLGYLDAISLGKAAQVSRGWKALADDDLLWRRMCGQHIERKCEKCKLFSCPTLELTRQAGGGCHSSNADDSVQNLILIRPQQQSRLHRTTTRTPDIRTRTQAHQRSSPASRPSVARTPIYRTTPRRRLSE